MKNSFLKPLSQKFEALTSRGDVINLKRDEKGSHCYCIYHVDRKLKIKTKIYFEVYYSFVKLFSQSFEALTQLGDFIKPKLTGKRAHTCISRSTNGVGNYLFPQSFRLNIHSSSTFT